MSLKIKMLHFGSLYLVYQIRIKNNRAKPGHVRNILWYFKACAFILDISCACRAPAVMINDV